MITNKRLNEIKANTNLTEQSERELKQTIEKADKMSENNSRLFRRLLI